MTLPWVIIETVHGYVLLIIDLITEQVFPSSPNYSTSSPYEHLITYTFKASIWLVYVGVCFRETVGAML